MKNLLKKIITFILHLEMRIVLKRHKPEIIGVTGSVGKTSAKEAIYAVLHQFSDTAKSQKSFNSAIGVPLAVLGLPTAYHSLVGWLKNIVLGFLRALSFKPYPKVLVLEMGVDHPGDMDELVKVAAPTTAVITEVGEIPVHVEFFPNPDAVLEEKAKILSRLTIDDKAILNYDNERIRKYVGRTSAQTTTFGFGEGADVRAHNYHVTFRQEKGRRIPSGITFKITYKGSTVPVRMRGIFGKQHVYAALIATAVGVSREINLVEISEALSEYHPAPGRFRLLAGINDSLLIDDSYNSSPLATEKSVLTFSELDGRRIAVLGDMLELGSHTVKAHKKIGKIVAEHCAILIAVGTRAGHIAEAAREAGMPDYAIFECQNSEDAAKKLHEIIKRGDIVLIKGSQSVRMEKVTEEVMLEREKSQDLLVRQDVYWKDSGRVIRGELLARLIAFLPIVFSLFILPLSPQIGGVLLLAGILIFLYVFLKSRKGRDFLLR